MREFISQQKGRKLKVCAFRIKKNHLTTGGEKVNLDYLEIIEGFENTNVQYIDWTDIGMHSLSEACCSKIKKISILFHDMFFTGAGVDCFSDYDVVFFGSYIGMRILPILIKVKKKSTETKLVCIMHHYLRDEYKGVKNKIYGLIQNRVIELCDYIIYADYPVFDKTIREKIVEKKKIRFIGIGFNKHIRKDVFPVEKNILCISSIMRHKGIDRLLKAVALLKEKNTYKVNIVGRVMDRQYYDELKDYCIKNKLDEIVSFKGRVSEEEKGRMLSEADVFAFPSCQEGYGIAMIEAMEYGIPVIAFDNSAIPYTVHDYKNGRLIKEGDLKGFSNAISEICYNRNLRNKLSQGSYKTAENCQDKADVVRRLNDFIVELSY